jgi:hypothetical protein
MVGLYRGRFGKQGLDFLFQRVVTGLAFEKRSAGVDVPDYPCGREASSRKSEPPAAQRGPLRIHGNRSSLSRRFLHGDQALGREAQIRCDDFRSRSQRVELGSRTGKKCRAPASP